MLGKTISHYKILEKLGEGGMGVIYKAEDTRLKRPVALKFLLPELTRDSEAKERFINEARAASGLDHPNICTIHEIGETGEGQMFIVMALCEGESLKTKIRRGQLPLEEAIDITTQVAAGLAKAHSKGIVHRDIKPANVMVTSDGEVKLVDFGLATLAGQARLTKMGALSGTAAYMSPEQARGEEIDHRTDIWSLGVVFYEMVTGQLPFRGEYETAVVYSILNDRPRPISSLRGGLSRGLERVIEKALAKSQEKRYQTIADMLADLQSLGGRPAGAMVQREAAEARQRRKSVAVLPFRSLSESKEDEYFSDGTTEDIITQLSKIGELRVISRTSVMRYKQTEKSIPEIGRELDVATILEGSVRRAGERVRIVAQLVDAQEDEHIWAETYDRDMKDIFAIQSDVAEKIAAALKAKLSPQEKERIEKEATINMEAYNYYLKGREYYYRYKNQDNETAITLFKKALELDPDYAIAWAGLGDAYAQRFARYGMAISWLDSAVDVSKKAIGLDGNCAEAHKALGLAYFHKGLTGEALEAFHRAIELNPNYHPAVGNIAVIYLSMGEFDKAILWLKKEIQFAPTLPFGHAVIGWVYRILGDFAKAEESLKSALELQPDYDYALYLLFTLYLVQDRKQEMKEFHDRVATSRPENARFLEYWGMCEGFSGDLPQAKDHYQRSIEVNSSFDTDSFAFAGIGLAHILLKEGKTGEAEQLLDQARKLREKRIEDKDVSEEPRCDLARIHAILGNRKEALAWLDKAIEAGWRDYQMALLDPWLENLRDNEQFREAMARVKTKVDEMRKRVEETEQDQQST